MNNPYGSEDKRVLMLLDQATDKQKEVQLRLDALESFKQLVEEQSIILQPELLLTISSLLRDSVNEVKEWIVDFMDFAYMKLGLPRALRKDSMFLFFFLSFFFK
jgi:hypothetical protein